MKRKNNIYLVNYHIFLVTYLFTNPTIWMMRLKNFTYTHRKKSSLDDLEKSYKPWNRYMYFVNKIEEWKPSPNQSGTYTFVNFLVTLCIQPRVAITLTVCKN